jgi:hypothetical protein
MGVEFGTLDDKPEAAKPIMALCDHPFAGIVNATNAHRIQLAGVGSLARVPRGESRGRAIRNWPPYLLSLMPTRI